jgi:hypothetical protein
LHGLGYGGAITCQHRLGPINSQCLTLVSTPTGPGKTTLLPEDYRRVFLDKDAAVIALLPKVRHIAPAYADELLAKSASPQQKPDNRLQLSRWSSR